MGLEGGISRYDDSEHDKIEEPLLDKSDDQVGRGYRNQPDSVVSIPSSQDGSSIFGYNLGVRPFQDIPFAVIFLLLVLVSVALGIYGVKNSNPDFQWTETAHYEPGQGCSIPEQLQLETSSSSDNRFWAFYATMPRIFRNALVKGTSYSPIWIAIGTTLILSGPLALGLLYLLRNFAKELVYATLPFLVLLPIVLNLTWFISCQRNIECSKDFDPSAQYVLFGIVLLMCALMVYVIYSNWDRIELTIRIIKTAAEALNQNLALVIVLPALSLVLFLLYIPIATFMAYAYTNGRLVPNPDFIDQPDTHHCGRGTDTPCCVWEPEEWVPYYIYLSGFAILWASTIMAQIQVFTISGTIAQWYFAQAYSSTVGATKRALRNSLGPSFGTVSLAGLVVAFVRVIRAAVNKADNEQSQQGAIAIVLRACLECILQAVEFFTRFTSNFAAITGESFCSSATMTYNLLKRNFLSTVLVEVISDRLLSMIIFVFSILYAFLMFGVLYLTTSLGTDQKLLASISSWLILFLVFILFIRVLSNIVDTVYICYAMDKDQGVVSKPEFREVFVLLPDESPSLAVPTAD